jgi:hypothetical protein
LKDEKQKTEEKQNKIITETISEEKPETEEIKIELKNDTKEEKPETILKNEEMVRECPPLNEQKLEFGEIIIKEEPIQFETTEDINKDETPTLKIEESPNEIIIEKNKDKNIDLDNEIRIVEEKIEIGESPKNEEQNNEKIIFEEQNNEKIGEEPIDLKIIEEVNIVQPETEKNKDNKKELNKIIPSISEENKKEESTKPADIESPDEIKIEEIRLVEINGSDDDEKSNENKVESDNVIEMKEDKIEENKNDEPIEFKIIEEVNINKPEEEIKKEEESKEIIKEENKSKHDELNDNNDEIVFGEIKIVETPIQGNDESSNKDETLKEKEIKTENEKTNNEMPETLIEEIRIEEKKEDEPIQLEVIEYNKPSETKEEPKKELTQEKK